MELGRCLKSPVRRVNLVLPTISIQLTDLAKEFPATQVDGFDISAAQLPPSSRLPKNVTLGTFNVLEAIPEHLLGKYDVVHVGLLILVVGKDDPLAILESLLALLTMNSLTSQSCITGLGPLD